MPRKKLQKPPLPEVQGRDKVEDAPPNPPSAGEDELLTSTETTGPEAAVNPSNEQSLTSFTPANIPSADPKPDSSLPARRPVERLASLNLNDRRSSRPSFGTPIPDTPQRIKKLKFQPKSAARRSKEEREATERAEAERLSARLAVSDTSNSVTPNRGGFQNRGNLRGGPGGVSNRWESERYAGAGAAGFLGGATPAEDKRQREATPRSRGGGRFSMLSGLSRESTAADSGSKVKKEPGPKQGKITDKDGDVIMSGTGSGKRTSSRVKKEQDDLTRESSDDDDLLQLEPVGRKINIEEINLISDDEFSDIAEVGKGKERARTPRLPSSSFMRPVRIGRHEHEERTIAVNTEASSLTSAELRRRAKAKSQAEGSLFLPGTPIAMKDRTSRDKGKACGQDVEFIKNERRWQGVYQDGEDDDRLIAVKEEPRDNDEAMVVEDEPSSSQVVAQDTQAQTEATLPKDDAAPVPASEPRPTRELKPRESRALIKRKPVLQTEEDHQEWLRYKQDVLTIEDHLHIPIAKSPDADEANIRRTQQTTVYLFQLPPILPDIEDPQKFQNGLIRRKPAEFTAESEVLDVSRPTAQDPTNKTDNNTDPKSKPAITTPSSGDAQPIKPEASAAARAVPSTSKAPSTHALPPHTSNPLPPGHLGTITLDATGFPSATWTPQFRLDLGRASDYGALQEVVLLKSAVVELASGKEGKGVRVKKGLGGGTGGEGVEKEEGMDVSRGGKAWAVGSMGGGFVMGPDWGWMFGR
ncbi:MAG: hypothetical protein L6R40_006771 [Gallowayella cf. fulva]|nr:MAG: hypothetical protein L6R40_006771 [Xanthomendoza cf. fulva]